MPSPVVHLFVADKLADCLEIKNIPDFLLGAVSPDAVNLHGQAEENIRYASHLRTKDYNVWKQNIRKFQNEQNDLETDFKKGFVCHLFTDIAWDELIQPELFRKLTYEFGVPENRLKKEKWQEMSRFNKQLIPRPEWKTITRLLSMSTPRPVSTVSAEMLEDLKNILLTKDPETLDEPPLFLNFSHIGITAQGVAELFKQLDSN